MTYNTPPNKERIEKTVKALQAKGLEVAVVKSGTKALELIKEIIPEKASVMNGSSVTLEQIGFVEYLKSGKHNWNNMHEAIILEKDPIKQATLRKQSVLSDYYLGSVHGLAENGEFVIGSNTGSQLPHIVYTSPNLIFVVSTKKIVPTLAEAMKRLEEYVVPLENEHMMKKHGTGTSLNKIVVFKNENPRMGRKVHVILVEEDLGF